MLPCESVADVYLTNEAREFVAYEYLWAQEGASFKTIAALFGTCLGCVPSDLVDDALLQSFLPILHDKVVALGRSSFSVKVNNLTDYPVKLRDARSPVELLYYKGDWDLVYGQRIVAIVGSRKPSEDGVRRTKKLVRMLVADGYTIMSGLAEGVDATAHSTAIQLGGKTIAVIGTPIDQYYPKKNRLLQDEIAQNHLLISQVPFEKYAKQDYRLNRFFFPERNVTMSALSQATVIIEASETSGTLTQARAALSQGRKLFILENNYRNTNITWPEKFSTKGAYRLKTYDDFLIGMR